MLIEIAIAILIGSIIAWVTNVLSIKMLFRPVYPIRISILGIRVQGLIPKRISEIAVSVGSIIEEELISIDEIISLISNEKNKTTAVDSIKKTVSDKVNKKIPFIVPFIIRESALQYIEGQIEKEAPNMIENIIKDTYAKSSKEIKIGKIVEDKINEIDLNRLEEIVMKIAKEELKHIEILGGILGALIGLMQGILVNFLIIY